MNTVACSMSPWMRALADDTASDPKRRRSCILLWMQGGPSQFETFDPKPAHANGGETKAVDTAARAYGLAPDNAAIADTYGLVLFENGDRDKALLMLRKAARLAPDNAEIRGHLQRVESAR